MKIIYAKGERLFCTNCGDHLLTFAIDATDGTAINENLIKQDEGQAPWCYRDIMKCRKCGTDYFL